MGRKQIPDLKVVIPEVKGKVLEGTSLVFSGLVPTHQRLETSRAYLVARSLGAEVTQDFTENTTHLVAVRSGKDTFIHVIVPDRLIVQGATYVRSSRGALAIARASTESSTPISRFVVLAPQSAYVEYITIAILINFC